jgi:Domain of unknown function (DUF4082)/Bacterial Ig domain
VQSLLFAAWAVRRWSIAVVVLLGSAATVLFSGAPAAASSYPFSVLTSPTAGSVLTVGTPVIFAGGASDGETGPVRHVEVSLDGGATWDLVEGGEVWWFVYTPTEPGELSVLTRATSANAGTTGSPSGPTPITVGAGDPPPRSCPCALTLPTLPDRPMVSDPDEVPVEVGLRFALDRDGVVTGLRLHHFAGNTGPLEAHFWTGNGDLLATATLADPTGPLVPIAFSQPVPVQAGETYVISYYTPSGHYASSEDYFAASVVNPPFATIVDENGGSGVYHYGTGGGFPDQTWHASNYWVEPIFTTA